MKNLFRVCMLFAGTALLMWGCGKPEIRCASPEDNPAHHYASGLSLIEKGDLKEADAKFERALYCDDGYGPAHGGLAITAARRASETRSKEALKEVSKHLKAAYKGSATPEEEFAYRLASIRVHTALKDGDWLDDSEDDHKAALKLKVDERKLLYYDGREAADYFMGLAYIDGREFQKARDRFDSVLKSRREGKWHDPAEVSWKKTDKLVRALSGITLGDIGNEVAVMDSIGRADMAALLVDELKVEKLFAGRIPLLREAQQKPEIAPVDMSSNPFRHEVGTIIRLGIRGLEPSFDKDAQAYAFRPSDPVTRKEFALALEDILIKLTTDGSMASAFLGHGKSPFPDVLPSSAWYNAIMNVTTRNLMETELSGEFRPDDNLDGAEAILAIRVLRHRLNIY